MNKSSQKHEFAFYFPDLKASDTTFIIREEALVKRIGSVLRLKKDDVVLFFTREMHVVARLESVNKKEIKVTVLEKKQNLQQTPTLKVILPLLKREAFEAALYACVELGTNEIVLVSTDKSLRIQKEKERYQKILIAAAEQSKHFSFPLIEGVRPLVQVLSEVKADIKIFADPQGQSFQSILSKPHHSYVLMIGPEGDLTLEEKELLKKEQFVFCRLTQTILRSPQALTVMLGLIRTLL